MPNINDAFPSKYLKASALQGQEPVVTIDRVDFEPVGRDREMKAVLYFAGKQKGLVLNKTNATKITDITGTAITEEWHGARVRLYSAEATFGGDTYDVIRVKAVTKPATQVAPPPPPPPADPVDESEIPF